MLSTRLAVETICSLSINFATQLSIPMSVTSSTEMASLPTTLAAPVEAFDSSPPVTASTESSPAMSASLQASLHSSLPLPLPPLPISSHYGLPPSTAHRLPSKASDLLFTAHRLPSKASDLLFGGNKSHTTRPASNSLPGSKRSSGLLHASSTTCHSPTPPTRGKEYDVLGESRLLIETFRDASKAMQRLGVLEGREKDDTGGVIGRRRRGGGRNRARHQHSRSLDGAQIVALNDGVGGDGGGGRSGLVRRVRTLWRSPSPAPTSPRQSHMQHSQPRQLAAAGIAPSSSTAVNSSLPHSSASPSPLPTSSSHPLSPKVRSLLLGPKPANKLHDRLGMTVAMMDLFSSQPKAFQRLGLFSTTQAEERRNVNGVVVSGMRQLMNGWLWIVEGKGMMRRVRRKYWVLTLDALTWYDSEEEMMAGGEVNFMHGAVVRRDRDWVLEPPVMGVVRSRRRRDDDGPIGAEEKEEKEADDEAEQRPAGVEDEREGVDWGQLAEERQVREEEEKVETPARVRSPATTTAPTPSASLPCRARVLYGFSVTPLRSISGDTRTYHLLAPTAASLQAWTKAIITTLRKAKSRSGVIVHDASRSSDMPGNLTYLHSRTKEGWLFRLSSTLSPLTHSSSSQWLPRYCILSNTSLSIFLSADHTTPAARAQGKLPLYTLSLRECSVIAVNEEVGGGQGWVFELRGHRVHNMGEHHKHVFGCVSAAERREWMRLLDFAGNGGRRRHVSWTEAKLSEVDSKVGDSTGTMGLPSGGAGSASQVRGGARADVLTPSSVGVSLSAVAVTEDSSKAEEVEELVSRASAETAASKASTHSTAAARVRTLLPSPHSHSLSAHRDEAEHTSTAASQALEDAEETQVIDL